MAIPLGFAADWYHARTRSAAFGVEPDSELKEGREEGLEKMDRPKKGVVCGEGVMGGR